MFLLPGMVPYTVIEIWWKTVPVLIPTTGVVAYALQHWHFRDLRSVPNSALFSIQQRYYRVPTLPSSGCHILCVAVGDGARYSDGATVSSASDQFCAADVFTVC